MDTCPLFADTVASDRINVLHLSRQQWHQQAEKLETSLGSRFSAPSSMAGMVTSSAEVALIYGFSICYGSFFF